MSKTFNANKEFPYKWKCSCCGTWQDSLAMKEYLKKKEFYDTYVCDGCKEGDPRDSNDEFDNDRGGTGHGDDSLSDADPGL